MIDTPSTSRFAFRARSPAFPPVWAPAPDNDPPMAGDDVPPGFVDATLVDDVPPGFVASAVTPSSADESLDNYADLIRLSAGCAVRVEGNVVESQGKGQDREIQAERVEELADHLIKARQPERAARLIAGLDQSVANLTATESDRTT